MSTLRSPVASILALLLITAAVSADTIRQINLPTNDLIYDPFGRRIYASVPGEAGANGNSVTVIDPEAGTVGASIFVGSEPDKLALSGNGQYLYVALDGAAAVRRLDLATQTAGLRFTLGRDPRSGPYFVEDMAAMPGHPETVAIARQTPSFIPRHAGVAIYDNGVPRPVGTALFSESDAIAFSASPARLYGFDNESSDFGLRRMLIDPLGVTVSDTTDNLISGYTVDIRYGGGWIYATSGVVIDPEAQMLVGTFPGIPDKALVLPDPAAGRVYFLTGAGSERTLRAFDQQTFVPRGSLTISGVAGTASSLIRWGSDGIAFRTSEGQLFLIRTALVPAGDLSLGLIPPTAAGGQSVVGMVALSAPAPAGGVSLQLESDSAAAAVPAQVVVPAGATTAAFPLITAPTAANVAAVISATGGHLTGSARLTVLAPFVVGISLNPSRVDAGAMPTGTVLLSGPAPSDIPFTLSSADPAVATVPAGVTIPAGASAAGFPITTHEVRLPSPASVTITANGLEAGPTATLTVSPSALDSLVLSPNRVTGGAPATGTVTLTAPAPDNGISVTLATDYQAPLTLPASVHVPGGATCATFPITTRSVSTSGAWQIYASYQASRQTARLEVTAAAPPAHP